MGMCGVYPTSTYTDMVPTTRDECNSFRDNIKPSIGTNGEFCVCVKPNESYDAETSVYSVDDATFQSAQTEYAQNHEQTAEDTGSMDDVHELYQSDFEDGTYRIKMSGTYKIMEDIEFDFNSGDLDDPNSGRSWWPTSDQSDEYPGAGTTRGTVDSVFLCSLEILKSLKIFENV